MSYLELLRLFFRLSLLNELQYRASFWLQLLQALLSLGLALGGLAVVFEHTSSLGGWQPVELVALVGVYTLVSGLVNLVIQPSLQQFMEDVRLGTLDFTLIKPANPQFLVSVRSFHLWELIDILLGLIVLGIALIRLKLPVTPWQFFAFSLALGAGLAIIYSFWLMLATLSFWFVRLEDLLAIFQSVYQAGRWPISIYPTWLRLLLTFLVPIAFAVTIPAEALAGRLTWPALLGAGGLALSLVIGSHWFWQFGLRHYRGASA